jgi:hypothetical protein
MCVGGRILELSRMCQNFAEVKPSDKIFLMTCFGPMGSVYPSTFILYPR